MFLGLFPCNSFAGENPIDSLVQILIRQKGRAQNTLVDSILANIDKEHVNSAKKNIDKLLQITAASDFQWGNIRTAIYSAHRFGLLPNRIGLLNQAISRAEKDGFQDLVAQAEQVKGNLYTDNNLFDSAMVATLHAMELFEKMHDGYGLIAEKHTIADLYYYAGNYDRAELLYKEIMQKHGNPDAWERWRRIVITNDLGLIEKRRGNYQKAVNFFRTSESYILRKPEHQLSFDDSSHLAYIYNQLAEIFLAYDKPRDADLYYYKTLKLEERVHSIGALGQLFATKAGICFKEGHNDSALVYVKKASLFSKEYRSLDLDLQLYSLLYKIYERLGDYTNAFHAQNTYGILKDSSTRLHYETKFMDILFQNNYDRYTRSIEENRRKQVLYLTGFVIVALLLSLVSLFYFRTKRINKLLVKKIIAADGAMAPRDYFTEQQGKPESVQPDKKVTVTSAVLQKDQTVLATEIETQSIKKNPFITMLPKENDFTGVQQELITDLADKIESLMKEKRMFLNPDLSLDDIARELETNRLYVSRAINSELYTNFISYVNEFRIKESIRLISLGEHKVLSMEGIAHASGFNNRKSFSAAFLKFNGINPTEFIKSYERYFKNEIVTMRN